MSRRISDKTKKIRKMGEGTGKDYKPYITTSEFNSMGTTSVIKDWKTGRGVHCLSQGEMLWYYILRWDDENIDIREQYPLDYAKTVEIAESFGLRIPQHIMTTDFLVTKADGRSVAYSVKTNSDLKNRKLELLFIEKHYWISQGAGYQLLLKTDANRILAGNIRLVTEFYDADRVFDEISAIKHKIAIKEYPVDMAGELLDEAALKRIRREKHV